MNVLDFLIPIKGTHSIVEVVFAVFPVEKIIIPENKLELLENEILKKYFNNIKVHGVSELGINFDGISVNDELSPQIDHKKSELIGFELLGLNNDSTIWSLKLMNESNISRISLHNLSYDRWQTFKEAAYEIFHAIAELYHYNINVFNITYIDQFEWQGEGYVPIREVLKEDSGYFPANMLEAKNYFSITMSKDVELTQNDIQLNFAERYIVDSDFIVNDKRFLSINHQTTYFLSEVFSLKEIINSSNLIKGSNHFNEVVEFAHKRNKDFLFEILTQNLTHKIGLSHANSHK